MIVKNRKVQENDIPLSIRKMMEQKLIKDTFVYDFMELRAKEEQMKEKLKYFTYQHLKVKIENMGYELKNSSFEVFIE